MKAVYLLLFLVLPTVINGYIFSHRPKKSMGKYMGDHSEDMEQQLQQYQDMSEQFKQWKIHQQRLASQMEEPMLRSSKKKSHSKKTSQEDTLYESPEYKPHRSRDQNSEDTHTMLHTVKRLVEIEPRESQENKGKNIFVTIIKNLEPTDKLLTDIETTKEEEDSHSSERRTSTSTYRKPHESSENKLAAGEKNLDNNKRKEKLWNKQMASDYPKNMLFAENANENSLEKIHKNSRENSYENSQELQSNVRNMHQNAPKSPATEEIMQSMEQPTHNSLNVHNVGLRRFLPGANSWPLFSALSNFAFPTYESGISWTEFESMLDEPNAFSEYVREVEKIGKNAYENIKPKSEEDRKRFHVNVETESHLNYEDVHLNATELSRKYNYTVEEHTVKTEDGYLLTLFRIISNTLPTDSVQRQVAFLMHGLLGSADDWLVMGPKLSLGFSLADAGFDVWLGNVRGNKYSHRHETKQPDERQFWQFTNDEIAAYDLPAMINYVLSVSKQEKLYYIGHSQGTTTFFALASSRPEYNDKIIAMYALAPTAYMSYTPSPMLRMVAPHGTAFDRIHEQMGHKEFKPSKDLLLILGGDLCHKIIGCDKLCSNVNFVMTGVNEAKLNVSQVPIFLSHLPAGTSTRVIKHYGQAVSSQEFRKYNYGESNNQRMYGSSTPPKYDLQKVTVPVTIFSADDDWLAHPKDVARLTSELGNVAEHVRVSEPWSHMDFILSMYAPEVIYKRLISSLKHQNN